MNNQNSQFFNSYNQLIGNPVQGNNFNDPGNFIGQQQAPLNPEYAMDMGDPVPANNGDGDDHMSREEDPDQEAASSSQNAYLKDEGDGGNPDETDVMFEKLVANQVANDTGLLEQPVGKSSPMRAERVSPQKSIEPEAFEEEQQVEEAEPEEEEAAADEDAEAEEEE